MSGTPSLFVGSDICEKAKILINVRSGESVRDGIEMLLKSDKGSDGLCDGISVNAGELVAEGFSWLSANPFEALSIPLTSETADIRKAYKKLALKYHPDKNPKTTALFQAIQAAQDRLSDTTVRQAEAAQGSQNTAPNKAPPTPKTPHPSRARETASQQTSTDNNPNPKSYDSKPSQTSEPPQIDPVELARQQAIEKKRLEEEARLQKRMEAEERVKHANMKREADHQEWLAKNESILKREREEKHLREEEQRKEREKHLRADEQAYFKLYGHAVHAVPTLSPRSSVSPTEVSPRAKSIIPGDKPKSSHDPNMTDDEKYKELKRKPLPYRNPSQQQVPCSPMHPSTSDAACRNGVIIPKPFNIRHATISSEHVDLKWQLPSTTYQVSTELSWRNITQFDRDWTIAKHLLIGSKIRKRNLAPGCHYRFRVRCVASMPGGLPGGNRSGWSETLDISTLPLASHYSDNSSTSCRQGSDENAENANVETGDDTNTSNNLKDSNAYANNANSGNSALYRKMKDIPSWNLKLNINININPTLSAAENGKEGQGQGQGTGYNGAALNDKYSDDSIGAVHHDDTSGGETCLNSQLYGKPLQRKLSRASSSYPDEWEGEGEGDMAYEPFSSAPVDLWYQDYDESGNVYFYNSTSGESVWEAPEWVEEYDDSSGVSYYMKLERVTGNPLMSTWSKPALFARLIRKQQNHVYAVA